MNEQSERTQIAELITEIVTAYVSHHKIQVLDVPSLINAVATALRSLGTGATPIALERPEPAVSVRRSVRPDHLVCLICGLRAFAKSGCHALFGLRHAAPSCRP
jgi:predicted transcriptional regulator